MADVVPQEAFKTEPKRSGKPSCWKQFLLLMWKNFQLQKRDLEFLSAEYLVMPLYLIFWVKIMMWVFPDDRPSLDELRDTEAELNRVLPSACYFAAKTAFVPATLYAKTIM